MSGKSPLLSWAALLLVNLASVQNTAHANTLAGVYLHQLDAVDVDAGTTHAAGGQNTTFQTLGLAPSNYSAEFEYYYDDEGDDDVEEYDSDDSLVSPDVKKSLWSFDSPAGGRMLTHADDASDSTTSLVVASNTSDPDASKTAVAKKPELGECCDDMDCGPTAPSYIDCDKALDCSVTTCPLNPRAPGPGGRLMSIMGEDADGDDCNTRAPPGEMCTCTCRCVCMYPSGELVWLEWPTVGDN
eukprot:TRINITY_DN122737_c0_g1_i1.p1 TRINITY_DN122737_c0_g1~~TRINITY_DN122737_c0_g1_i1.p1  ORF type:complete len:242 (-),score=26.87 TRINITY_DN122737_c0_g1_i1:56-781(-)